MAVPATDQIGAVSTNKYVVSRLAKDKTDSIYSSTEDFLYASLRGTSRQKERERERERVREREREREGGREGERGRRRD